MEKDHIHPPQTDNSPSTDQLLNTNEAAEKLAISRRSFYRQRKEIEPFVPPVILGKRSIRYRLSDVLNFIKRGGFDA